MSFAEHSLEKRRLHPRRFQRCQIDAGHVAHRCRMAEIVMHEMLNAAAPLAIAVFHTLSDFDLKGEA